MDYNSGSNSMDLPTTRIDPFFSNLFKPTPYIDAFLLLKGGGMVKVQLISFLAFEKTRSSLLFLQKGNQFVNKSVSYINERRPKSGILSSLASNFMMIPLSPSSYFAHMLKLPSLFT